jgi:transposase
VPPFQDRTEGGSAVGLGGDIELVVGVDTHLDTHTAALCDGRGRAQSQLRVPATAAGDADLLDWARAATAGRPVAWAIEGTRHYGLGLARYLACQGQQVAEIDATRHVGKRRAGKSDAIDAVRAARELLARPHPGQVRADADREALRLLMVDRDNAVQAGKTARTALASVLVTAPAPLRDQLRTIPPERRARACAQLSIPPRADRRPGPGRGKIAAQTAQAAVVFALANLGTPDFRAWLRDGSLWPRRAAVARNGPARKPNGSRLVSPVSLVLSNYGCDLWAVQDLNL